MSRLIDADKLIEELKNLAKGEVPSCPNIAEYFVSIRVDRIIDRLNNQPTAYDVDKVVEKLEENSLIFEPDFLVKAHKFITTKNAIEIIKAGGIDERDI